MPFALLALGILFLVVSIQGTQAGLFSLLKSEFVGTNSFIPWIAAILILGLLGYIKPIRPITHAFIALIFIVLVLANGTGFFSRFNSAIKNPVSPPQGNISGSITGSAGAGAGLGASPVTAPALAGPLNMAPSGTGQSVGAETGVWTV